MADNGKIIALYTELAEDPSKDFGWDKGLKNAKAHGYKKAWIDAIPPQVWEYCAAVGNPFKDADIKEGDAIVVLGKRSNGTVQALDIRKIEKDLNLFRPQRMRGYKLFGE